MKLIRGRCYLTVFFASTAALLYIVYYCFVKVSGDNYAQRSAYQQIFNLQLGNGGQSRFFQIGSDGKLRSSKNVSELDLFADVDKDELVDMSQLEHHVHHHQQAADGIQGKGKSSSKGHRDGSVTSVTRNDDEVKSDVVGDRSDAVASKTPGASHSGNVNRSGTKQRRKPKTKRVTNNNSKTETSNNVLRTASARRQYNDVSTFVNANRTEAQLTIDSDSYKKSTDLVNERRRLAETKRRLLQEKIWFDQDVNEILKTVREGGVVEVNKKPDTGPPKPVDPSYWDDLDAASVYRRFPGLVLQPDYVLNRPFIDVNDSKAVGMQGSPQSLDDMTDGQAEDRFYQLISMVHIDCRLVVRMGSVNDGGWDICNVSPYSFTPGGDGCLVYSFGINYDFTFDDAMALAFNCTVKSFDPSMTVFDHVRSVNVHFYQLGLGAVNTVDGKNGWKLMSLNTIKSKLGHTQRVIDVLKIDIEYNEWACLRKMVTDGSLSNVKQLIFEIHTSEVENIQQASLKQDFFDMYATLASLELIGFRRYNYHYNTFGQYTSYRTGKTRSCCYELYYVNIRFLRSRN